jgi:hypothetical protein
VDVKNVCVNETMLLDLPQGLLQNIVQPLQPPHERCVCHHISSLIISNVLEASSYPIIILLSYAHSISFLWPSSAPSPPFALKHGNSCALDMDVMAMGIHVGTKLRMSCDKRSEDGRRMLSVEPVTGCS